jgi:NAD(P)-dependent dehydrogenase (short-subunit alcohol dehydrogenase family)
MTSLGGAGESAVVVGAGELGSATATLLARAGFTVVPADRSRKHWTSCPRASVARWATRPIRLWPRPSSTRGAGLAAYSLGKAALSHLVRILDLELRPHGIGGERSRPATS